MNNATSNIEIDPFRSYFRNRTGSNIEGNCLRAIRVLKSEITAIWKYFNEITRYWRFLTRGLVVRGVGFEYVEKQWVIR